MDLAHELHDLVRTLDRWAEQMLRPEGLTYNQYVALVILGQHPGITGRTLSKSLGVTEAAGSGIVTALLTDGLITDGAAPGSGNRRELRLTSAGEDKHAHCARLLGHSLDDNARAIGIDPSSLASTIRALHDEVRTIRSDNPKDRS
ncbi:MarR family winged helix-turn-helix transcriptional regulator [Brevibacterium sp. FAM 24630]|uniref:MarR family winged helix-turn-helix transcriptional regulator n=1 Tax=Brevibacterium sp. FAM 24630 TaxID=3415680 RepID=UPI003C7A8C8B